MALTCLKGVVDFSIGSLVLVKGSDLHNLCAHHCRVRHFCFVMDAAELWSMKVAVIHMDDDSNKVPLDGDLLVSYLKDRGRADVVKSGSRQPYLHQASKYVIRAHRQWRVSGIPTPWMGRSL